MASLKPGIRDVVRGGAWIYSSTMVVSLTGFAYWLLAARLAGAAVVGVASSIISSSSIAATLVSAGIGVAAVREAASRGVRGVYAVAVLAGLMGVAAAALAAPLAVLLGYTGLSYMASFIALAGILATALGSTLIGLEFFRDWFASSVAASASKLSIGLGLVAMGLGALGVLAGYLAFSIVLAAASSLLLARRAQYLSSRSNTSSLYSGLRSAAAAAYSNYPYMFSAQLLVMLSVYLVALLTGRPVSTGILYIAMMVMVTLAGLPGSLLSASLPIGIHRDEAGVFSESVRLGLSILLPIVALLAGAAEPILSLISSELTAGATTLRILLLAIPPFTMLTGLVMKLNKEAAYRTLVVVGLARTLLLAALLVALAPLLASEGAALAFLTANTLLAPLAAYMDKGLAAYTARLWPAYLAVVLVSLVAPAGLYATLASLAVSLLSLYLARTVSLDELRELARLVLLRS